MTIEKRFTFYVAHVGSSSEISRTRTDLTSYVAQLIEHWTSKPDVAGSVHSGEAKIFHLIAGCGHTRRAFRRNYI
jgi:hypothetical protein